MVYMDCPIAVSRSRALPIERETTWWSYAIASSVFGTRVGPTHIQNRSPTIVSHVRERGDGR